MNKNQAQREQASEIEVIDVFEAAKNEGIEETDIEKLVDIAESLICKLEQFKEQGRSTPLTERYITDAELTMLLHTCSRTTQKWRSEGLVSYVKLGGGKVLYPVSSIEEMLTLGYHPAWSA